MGLVDPLASTGLTFVPTGGFHSGRSGSAMEKVAAAQHHTLRVAQHHAATKHAAQRNLSAALEKQTRAADAFVNKEGRRGARAGKRERRKQLKTQVRRERVETRDSDSAVFKAASQYFRKHVDAEFEDGLGADVAAVRRFSKKNTRRVRKQTLVKDMFGRLVPAAAKPKKKPHVYKSVIPATRRGSRERSGW
jgi:hypothetical protein